MDPSIPLSPHFSLSFSPSKARVQRAQAAEWQQIDSWLSSKYQGRSVPAFERNEDTLKALLALVAANEKADEEREVLWAVERKGLAEIEKSLGQDPDNAAILDALKLHLSAPAQQSLDALAMTSVAIDAPSPDAESIAHSLVDLTTQSHALQQQLSRVNYLQAYLQSHIASLRAQLRDIQPSKDGSSGFVVSRDLPQQTQEWLRNTKTLKSKLGEYEERLATLDSNGPATQAIGFVEVVQQEKELSDLRARLAQVQGQVRAYEGLPPDKEAARKEVQALGKKLEGLKRERDQIFAEMVGE